MKYFLDARLESLEVVKSSFVVLRWNSGFQADPWKLIVLHLKKLEVARPFVVTWKVFLGFHGAVVACYGFADDCSFLPLSAVRSSSSPHKERSKDFAAQDHE